jgi:hypothetical protein
MTSSRQQLETIANEVMEAFEVYGPPVPIELMLQKPHADMWSEVDVTQLSGSFLSVKDRFSPRMSLARLLARHVASSEWGRDRGVFSLVQEGDNLHAFARMLIMPEDMLSGLTSSNRNTSYIVSHFEVPQEDASQRLLEVFEG